MSILLNAMIPPTQPKTELSSLTRVLFHCTVQRSMIEACRTTAPPVEDCFQTDEGGTYTVKRSDAEDTYHDEQSQMVDSSDKGAPEVGISWPAKAYDNSRHGKGIGTHVHETDQDDAEEVAFEVTDNQGGKYQPTDDATFYASHALNNDDQSVSMESKYAENG